jgi:preprotein translocase subunit SecF
MRLFANAQYPFLEWRRRAYLASGLIILLGIAGMVYNVASVGSWLRYGVDFTGGTVVQVAFSQTTTVEEIRAVDPGWEISRFGTGDEFVIRMPSFNQEAGQSADDVVTARLKEHFPERPFTIVRTEAVGPKVGTELQKRALYAILISFALTLVYLAFRFEWRFGVAAIISTAHDIIVTLGFLALLRQEVSIGTVAALLTIVGYSLNDTIIIFDRIRENVAKPHRGESYMAILDRSINETLPRTVITSGTTLATLFALFVFGGAVIRDFALVLILGIAIGTFSSIFVAAPALYEITKKWPRKEKSAKGGARSSARGTAKAAL